MLKENQKIKTTWNPYTQKYYIEKGYKYTKRGDTFFVDINDLPKHSHEKVKVVCDYCGNEFEKTYKDYFEQHNGGDCCKNCQGKKSLFSTENKYGRGFRGRKLKEIAEERYGVENIAKLDNIQEKIKNTNIEKYGVVNALMLESSIQKNREISKKESVKEKRRKTNLEKYGYEYSLSSPDIRKKIAQSYYNNGTVPTSKQQLELYNLLKEIYGDCQLNFPCGNCLLDCVISVNGVQIDIEYDAPYWHQDKQKDRKRDEFVKSQGYKVYRIIDGHKIPQKTEIEEQINILLTTDKKYIETTMI